MGEWTFEKVSETVQKKPYILLGVLGGAGLLFFLFSQRQVVSEPQTVEIGGYPQVPDGAVGFNSSGVGNSDMINLVAGLAGVVQSQQGQNQTILEKLEKFQQENQTGFSRYEPLPAVAQPITETKVSTPSLSRDTRQKRKNTSRTVSDNTAYHPGVVIGTRDDKYMDSFQRRNKISNRDIGAIEAISREQGVDLGIAKDMFKSGTRAKAVTTTKTNTIKNKPKPTSGGLKQFDDNTWAVGG